jgi:hypothetical protein
MNLLIKRVYLKEIKTKIELTTGKNNVLNYVYL